MAEPTVYNKYFGGVEFNWNEVKSAKKVTDKYGRETFIVEFKTGIKAEYPEQNGSSMNSKELTMWQSFEYDNETIINGMHGAKITGSQKDDHIVAYSTHDCEIDVANDNNDDYVEVIGTDLDYEHDTRDTLVKLDKSDKLRRAHHYSLENHEENSSVEIKGPGIDNTF